MWLIEDIYYYCRRKGLLTPELEDAIRAYFLTGFGHAGSAFTAEMLVCGGCDCYANEGGGTSGCGKCKQCHWADVDFSNDDICGNIEKRREDSVSAKSRSGTGNRRTDMKLPALSKRLRKAFEDRLTDSSRPLNLLHLLCQTADLSTPSPMDDWPRFQEIVLALYRMDEAEIRKIVLESLQSKRKSAPTLNHLYALLKDSTETSFLVESNAESGGKKAKKFYGPAVNAFRGLMQLNERNPPQNLLWILKDEVVNTVYQYHCLKITLGGILARFWKEDPCLFEKWSLGRNLPFPPDWQNADWFDKTSMEVFFLLRSACRALEGKKSFSVPGLENIDMHEFDPSSWALALMIQPANVLQLLPKTEQNI